MYKLWIVRMVRRNLFAIFVRVACFSSFNSSTLAEWRLKISELRALKLHTRKKLSKTMKTPHSTCPLRFVSFFLVSPCTRCVHAQATRIHVICAWIRVTTDYRMKKNIWSKSRNNWKCTNAEQWQPSISCQVWPKTNEKKNGKNEKKKRKHETIQQTARKTKSKSSGVE